MDQTAPAFLSKRWWHVVRRDGAKAVAFIEIKDAKLGLTKPRRIRQHGLEHRLKLAGRAADDLQDLRGRPLLLQRLGKVLLRLCQLVGPLVKSLLEIGR